MIPFNWFKVLEVQKLKAIVSQRLCSVTVLTLKINAGCGKVGARDGGSGTGWGTCQSVRVCESRESVWKYEKIIHLNHWKSIHIGLVLEKSYLIKYI